jgi:hypothetical protein
MSPSRQLASICESVWGILSECSQFQSFWCTCTHWDYFRAIDWRGYRWSSLESWVWGLDCPWHCDIESDDWSSYL